MYVSEIMTVQQINIIRLLYPDNAALKNDNIFLKKYEI